MQNPNTFRCDGCGRKFESRGELERHERECTAKQNSGQGSSRPMTRTAGSPIRE